MARAARTDQATSWPYPVTSLLVEVQFRRCGTGATRESRRSSDQHSTGAYTSRFEMAGLP